MTNTNRIIERKPQHKNTKNLEVLRVTKLTNKSSHSTAKDSYKHRQHTSKYTFETPHQNPSYVLLTPRPVAEYSQTLNQNTV